MKIHRAYRYDLVPNTEQRILLAKLAGAARFAYNWGLPRRSQISEKQGRTTTEIARHRELNRLQ
ncbi:helix-turn-helix domain-containing protein [Hydrogenibacillus schlegelii]|uniref:helix-turn-helix domain-containing protein n=1 Tax=Hydrogenibacillus schlegelii TaxID=1484 RepID=UPI0034A053C4